MFALFLYRTKVNTARVMLSRFCINFFINVLIQTPIMMWYYALYMGGKQYTFAMAVPGMIKNILMFPIESVLLTLFLSICASHSCMELSASMYSKFTCPVLVQRMSSLRQ